MSQDEPPLCDTCGVLLTINHIIAECRKFQHFRNQFHISEQISQTLRPNQQDTRDII